MHPHNRARDTYREVDGQWHPRPAPRFSVTDAEPVWEEAVSHSAEHTLAELGVDGAQIAAWGANE